MKQTKDKNTLLIIDDEPIIRKLLSRILELEGYEVLQAQDRRTALKTLQEHDIQVVLCDVFLPDGNGVQMVGELKTIRPDSKIILLTAHGNIEDGVQAIKNGAFDYIIKGDDNRKIIPLISRAMDQIKTTPKVPTKVPKIGFEQIIGQSSEIQSTIRMARKVAATDVCVLLTGETGTGKEVFAHAIHNESPRKSHSFVAINCSAFSKELLESELFGHRAGAFTGAVKDKKGLFEEANGGTIFLDEVGEMEFTLQAKLLRVLENKEFIKLGDTKSTQVDVRVIAATNRNLKKEIELKNFREDLYFRLSVFQIQLPTLHQRKGDIRLLAKHFVETFSHKMNLEPPKISHDALQLLERYTFPGNIRELRNIIERALIVCDDQITCDDLPIDLRRTAPDESDEKQFDLASMEHNHIKKILDYTHGNKTETARLLKIGLTTLYRKMEEYGIPK